VYAFPDNDRININHALFSINYQSETVFGTAAVHAGRYVDTNYSAEPKWAKPIYSASLGYHLGTEWALEAGIFASHIGYETAIGKDNITLTRSLLADNSPYFESGIKLSYTPNSQCTISLLGLTGWQVISDQDDKKAIGTQIQYQITPTILLNSSFYAGDTRYFHDFFAVIQISDVLSLVPIIDVGIQEDSVWGGAALMAKYTLSPTSRLGARVEYYEDPNNVVTSGGVSLLGASLNYDHDILPNTTWRNEVKVLGKDTSWTTSLAIKVPQL
jgi:hypothetical protein